MVFGGIRRQKPYKEYKPLLARDRRQEDIFQVKQVQPQGGLVAP